MLNLVALPVQAKQVYPLGRLGLSYSRKRRQPASSMNPLPTDQPAPVSSKENRRPRNAPQRPRSIPSEQKEIERARQLLRDPKAKFWP